MSEYSSFIEPNPGGDTNCPYVNSDAKVLKFSDHIEVVANPDHRNVWINSIGANRFIDKFPNGENISVSKYSLSAEFRLKKIPKADPNQTENGEVIQSMIQIWDGRGELFGSGVPTGETYEFAFVWIINPWGNNFSQVIVYSGRDLKRIYTGINLIPDLEWHQYELVADFRTKKYVSFHIDGNYSVDISDLDIAIVNHTEWLGDTRILLSTTAEAEHSYPNSTCGFIFWYSAEFKNALFQIYDDTSTQTSYSSGNILGLSHWFLTLLLLVISVSKQKTDS